MPPARPDYPTIRLRVAQASLEASQQALRLSPQRALRQVQRLIDSELRRLPPAERGPVACRAGCDFCCHLRVMATAAEVFTLLDFLHSQLDPAAFEALAGRIRATDRQLRALEPDQVMTTNLPCPLLEQGRCSAYAARPLNCRSYHSLSVEACEDSFRHPEDLERGHPQLRAVTSVHAGAQGGLLRALESGGHDARQYELVTALAEALDDATARERFECRQPVFLRPPVVTD